MKKSELRKLIKEGIKQFKESRSVWKSSEYEEIDSSIGTIKDNLNHLLMQGLDETKYNEFNTFLDELESINNKLGTELKD